MTEPEKLPRTFNRLAWSNLAAQSAEQIALAAAPIVAVLLLGAGEGETGLLQTALTLPFVLFAIPAGLLADRTSRRWLMAGSEALRATALFAILGLIALGWLTLPLLGLPGLRRGVRHGGLQRRRTGAGAVAGRADDAAGRQRAPRARAHRGLRRRSGAGRPAGRLDRRQPGVRRRGGAVGDRGRAAVRPARACARATAPAPSLAGDPRRRGLRLPSSAAAAGVRHPVHLQHRVVRDPGRVRALCRAPSRPVGERRRHDLGDVRRRHDRRCARRPPASCARCRSASWSAWAR